MSTLQFFHNYRENKQLRESFFELATKTFDLHFEEWYEKGYWGDFFECFSIVDGNKVVANVSVSKVGLLIEGKSYKGLQIGTVMTDPDYQGQGLSKQLMNALLAKYEKEVDILYLFANETVLQFYTKFGFEKRSQSTYTVDAKNVAKKEASFRKLNMENDADRAFFYDIVKHRTPISQSFTTERAEDLVMFHSLFSYHDHIYYNNELDAVVIYKQSESAVIVYDVISKNAVPLLDVLSRLKMQAVQRFELCFTPDHDIPYKKVEFFDTGALFVKCSAGIAYPNDVLYPYTSLA